MPNFAEPSILGRYVILLHRNPQAVARPYTAGRPDSDTVNQPEKTQPPPSGLGDDHYDWMFESADGLATWATPDWLRSDIDSEVGAIRLPDHRRAYLEYEGPVSGNRGSVRRVEQGQFTLISADPDRYVLRTMGDRAGQVEIYRTCSVVGESFWRISFRLNTGGVPARDDAS